MAAISPASMFSLTPTVLMEQVIFFDPQSIHILPIVSRHGKRIGEGKGIFLTQYFQKLTQILGEKGISRLMRGQAIGHSKEKLVELTKNIYERVEMIENGAVKRKTEHLAGIIDSAHFGEVVKWVFYEEDRSVLKNVSLLSCGWSDEDSRKIELANPGKSDAEILSIKVRDIRTRLALTTGYSLLEWETDNVTIIGTKMIYMGTVEIEVLKHGRTRTA